MKDHIGDIGDTVGANNKGDTTRKDKSYTLQPKS